MSLQFPPARIRTAHARQRPEIISHSSPRGHAAIDRELYVPRSWTQDAARCGAAKIPAEVGFATKPALAARMINRALDAEVRAPWVTGDEVYGGNPRLRAALEDRQVGYVLAVARDHQIATRAGKVRADTLVKKLPKQAWQRRSAVAGAKRHRFYDWALAHVADECACHHICSFAATVATANSPFTAATRPARCRWARWCG